MQGRGREQWKRNIHDHRGRGQARRLHGRNDASAEEAAAAMREDVEGAAGGRGDCGGFLQARACIVPGPLGTRRGG